MRALTEYLRLYLPRRYHLRVAVLDARAWIGGWCHHRPWDAARNRPDRGGGYVHWRCQKRRGHDGVHRFNNYVWTDDGHTDYVPIPVTRHNMPSPHPRSPWATALGASYGQHLRQLRESKDHLAKIRARR